MYSICCGNEGTLTSVSDADRHVFVRELLFSRRLHSYARQVGYTTYDAPLFEEQKDFKQTDRLTNLLELGIRRLTKLDWNGTTERIDAVI